MDARNRGSVSGKYACVGWSTPEMTMRYAALADGTVRVAYDAAMTKLRQRRPLPLVVTGRPVVPDRIEWLRSEMIKTRVAHGYCSRHLAAEACPYANICEQCDNYVTTTKFLPHLTVPRQGVGRISWSGKLGVSGRAWPRWTSRGRFQARASCGRIVLNSTRNASACSASRAPSVMSSR